MSYYQSQKKLLNKQARWLDYLVKFKYEFEFSPSKTNVMVDALSRKSIIVPMYVTKVLLMEHIKERPQHDNPSSS